MAADNYKRTYGDVTIKESVLDQIEIFSALEDGFLSTLQKSVAINTVHVNLEEGLRTVQSRAQAEGADASLLATTAAVRKTNLTEIIGIPFGVSGTEKATSHYGFEDAYSHEAMKAMQDWTNAAEFDLVRSTLVSGASGTAPKMAGIIACITTNATAQTSGTVFSETIMNGLFQLTWANSNGQVATDVYVGAFLKRKISGFSGRAGSAVQVGETAAVNTVDFYLSDFGEHRIHLHRYVFVSGTDATQRFLAVRPEKWAIAYLREPVLEELSKIGDSERAQIIGELTVEARNERCSVFASGYHLTS